MLRDPGLQGGPLGATDGGNAVPRAQLLRAVPVLAAFALVAASPRPALATPETMGRSLGNLFMAPLDIIMSPYVAVTTTYTNWRDSGDSPAVKVAYPLPGVIWVTGVQLGASVLRGITGLIEFVPAIPLLFLDTDMDPLFDPVDRNDAVVDVQLWESFPICCKFGIDYTSQPSY